MSAPGSAHPTPAATPVPDPPTGESPDFPPTEVHQVMPTAPAAVEPESDDRAAEPEPAAAIDELVAPEPAPMVDEVIIDALARIEAQLSESQRLLDRQSEISAKLHAENQVLRAGELRKAQTAIVLSVLRVLDDVTQMAATAEQEAARADLTLVADSLADALARNGVDAVLVEPGVPFEGRSHKIVAIENTTDPSADRTVARVLRPGFAWAAGEAIRVSDVAVHKYVAPTEPESVAPTEPDPATAPHADAVTPASAEPVTPTEQ